MAINDVNNHPSVDRFYMENLARKNDVISYIDNVVVVLDSMDKQASDIVKNAGKQFLGRAIANMLCMGTIRTTVELHDALKRRSDDLISLAVKLREQIVGESEVELDVRYKGESAVEIYNIYTQEVIWKKREFNPKYTRILIQGFVDILKYTKVTSVVTEALRCLISFSTVYKDLRGSKEYTLHQEREAIDRLKQIKFQDNEEFERKCRIKGTLENDFIIFLSNFDKHESEMDPLFKSLTENIRRALSKFERIHGDEFRYYNMHRDANYSFKSSGTSYKSRKGRKMTIPALIASGFEEDYIKDRPLIKKLDELIGFTGAYGFIKSNRVRHEYRKSLSISQKKLARRVIHIAENSRQDRLGWYHNIVSAFFRLYKNDCTFNQNEGILFCKMASKDVDHAVYCMDQSKATDTMLISAQKLVLGILLKRVFKDDLIARNIAVKAWADMVSGERNTFYLVNKEKVVYQFVVGQPQGYLSSFSVFALLNHFIMLFSLYRYCQEKGIIKADGRKLYRIVGDDSAVRLMDNDEEGRFADIYIECNRMINVEVNKDKGYMNFGKRNSTTAEFAKVLSINGEYFTPTPFNIASSSANTSAEQYLKYLLWVHEKTGYQFKIQEVVSLVNTKFPYLTDMQKRGLSLVLTTNASNNDFYHICKENKDLEVDIDLRNRLIWFNFINLINKSIYKYGLTYHQNEEYLGIAGIGPALEAMFSDISLFKELDIETEVIKSIPKESKLYLEYSYDYIKRTVFPVLRDVATEDLTGILSESGLYTDYILEMLDKDLQKVNENLDTIETLFVGGPDLIDDEAIQTINKITPLLVHRSWSLRKYEIDSRYLQAIGEKLGDGFNQYANEILGTSLDVSKDNLVDRELGDIDLDLEIEFDDF